MSKVGGSCVKQNTKIISKSDIKHVEKYLWATMSLSNNFEIISGKFPPAEIKVFQTDVHEG